jgi:hypothetical protein
MKSQKKTKSTCNAEVFAEVAKELGLSLPTIREVFNAHSLFTRKTMEDNTFDGVRWPYLGVFKSKPKEVQILNHLKGLTPEQQREFKQQIKDGLFRRKRDERN